MSSDKRKNTAVDFAKHEAERRDEQTLSDQINEHIQDYSRALGRGGPKRFAYVALQLRDQLLPDLREYCDQPLQQYTSRLDDREHWDWVALRKFDNNSDALVRYFTATAGGAKPRTAHLSSGRELPGAAAKRCVRRALKSVTAIAEAEGIVHEDYAGSVDCHGFAVKTGEWLQDRKMNVGDPVNIVSWGKGGLKTLHGGGTGMSKSSGAETEAEDLYLYDPSDPGADLEFLPTSPFKNIDVVDLEKGESWFPDIPQQQEVLRDIREEKGLPRDFTEREDDPCSDRRAEVFAPLTDALGEQELPYDTGREEFTVQPFAIPASDIPRDIFVGAMEARVSKDEERTLKRIYDEVDDERDDWALKHLADGVREREELSDKHKRGAIAILRSLQGMGFIQTHADAPTIDWNRVFTDTDTYTIFTQADALMGDSSDAVFGKLFLILYIIDKIMRERAGDGAVGLPESNLILRELWEVVPHTKRDLDDERAAAIQGLIANRVEKIMRKNRHLKVNLIADTQFPYDLKNSVREGFNRYAIYSGTNKLCDGVVSWTGNNKSGAFAGSLTPKRGQASVVGEMQVAIDNRGIEFAGPVEYAPPSHHHWDKERDGPGWTARCKYLSPTEECEACGSAALERGSEGVELTCEDCGEGMRDLSMGREEVLQKPDWDTETPEHLQIEAYSPEDDTEDGEDGEEGDAIDAKAAHRLEARNRNRRGESIRQIRENIENNPDTGNPYSIYTIQNWVGDVEKGSKVVEEPEQ